MKKLAPTTVYLTYSSATNLFFAVVFTMNLVYQVTVVRLNPLQLVLVGTLLEATIFLFEIPTGVVADVYSRRLSTIIGVFLMGLGFITEGSFPYFGTVLLCQVLWGIGYTFTSGATEAWIADEVGEAAVGKTFLRGTQASIAGGLFGAIISTGLGNIRVNIPIVTGGFMFLLLGIFLILWMPEHGFTPKVRQVTGSAGPTIAESWKTMWSTFRSGVRLVSGKPALVTILTIGLFFGLYSEGFDRLWTPHLIQDITLPSTGGLTTVTWFGIINIVTQLLSLGCAEVARRTADPDHPRVSLWMLFANSAVLVSSLVVFALTRNFALALGAYWIISISRRLIDPYYTTWVNRHLTSDVRATVLSMSSQVDALGQIAGGPILGLIGNAVSIPAALVGSAILLSPVLGLLSRALQRERGREKRVESRE